MSQITYGSMRMTAATGSGDPAGHLCRLHDAGIDTHHSSHEYDSHDVYLDALRRARRTGREFRHIVKLAEPGFDHDRFDGSRLTALLDQRLSELAVETIDSVQWLFRTTDPQDSDRRVATLAAQVEEVTGWAVSARDAGKIRNLSFFPYSTSFAEMVMALGVSSTPAMYFNIMELESVPFLDPSDGFIAIRPLAGGRVPGPETSDGNGPAIAAALRFPLLHPKVTTSIVSINSKAHVDALLAVAATTPDRAAFDSALALAGR